MKELDKAIQILETQVSVLKTILKSYGDLPLEKDELKIYELQNKKMLDLNKLINKLKKL